MQSFNYFRTIIIKIITFFNLIRKFMIINKKKSEISFQSKLTKGLLLLFLINNF